MKVKKSDINLLIMLIGVLIAVASYFLVFQSYNEKTAALEAENAVLQEEVNGLQELADNKPYYESEIVRMESENQEIMLHFPAEVRVEDEIMYTVALENEHSIWVDSLNSGDTQLVQVAVAATEQPTNDAVVEEGAAPAEAPAGDAVVASGGLKDTVFLYNSPFTISFKTTYRSMKDIVYAIVTSDERMSLASLSLSYDAETGCLVGSLDSNMYTMSGTDAVYEELNIPGVAIGTADFFKSGTVLNLNVGASVDTEDDADAEEGADEDADEDEEEKSDDKVTSED